MNTEFAVQLGRAPAVERARILTDYLAREIEQLTGRGMTPQRRSNLPQDVGLQEIGLDSLSTMDLAARIEKDLLVTLSVAALSDSTTVGDLVEQVINAMQISGARGQAQASASPAAHAAPTAAIGRQRSTRAVALGKWRFPYPVFCIGGLGGMVSYLQDLGNALGGARPLIAFQAPGIGGDGPPLGSVEEMALRYIEELKSIQSDGPYVLAGHSFGGLVAYEMAQRLTERGEQVEQVFLIDTSAAESAAPASEAADIMAMFELAHMLRRFAGRAREPEAHTPLASMSPDEQRRILTQELGSDGPPQPGSAVANMLDVWTTSYSAMERYRPVQYTGAVTLFRAEGGFPPESLHPARTTKMRFDEPSLGWARLCPALRVVDVPGDHFTLILAPHVRTVADAVGRTSEHSTPLEIEVDRLLPAKPVRNAGRVIEVSRHGVHFNPHHPAFFSDPYPILHQLRTHAPVHFIESMSNWWFTRYTDVAAGFRDKRFSVDSRNVVDLTGKEVRIQANSMQPYLLNSRARRQEDFPLAKISNNFMLFLDPPMHRQLRQVVQPLFEPKAIQRWTHYIEKRVDELIADMRRRDDPDIVRDLALPLPVSVISEILGLPHEDESFLQQWAKDLFCALDPLMSNEATQWANKSAEDFLDYLREHVKKKRESPGEDEFFKRLRQAESSGQQMTEDELVTNYAMIFAAGFETTSGVIGNSVLALLRNPDQLRLLRQRPELAENAAEEFLRYDGNVRGVLRTALEDVEIGGALIRKGDSVVFELAAANRDPAMFPDPDRLDLARHNAKQQMAFSQGIHYCLGATLARLEIKSAMAALVRHDFTLVPGGFEWRQSFTFRGLERLRVTFTS